MHNCTVVSVSHKAAVQKAIINKFVNRICTIISGKIIYAEQHLAARCFFSYCKSVFTIKKKIAAHGLARGFLFTNNVRM